MDRELVLAILAAAVAGPLLALAGFSTSRGPSHESASLAERRHWRDLWAPCFPAAVCVAALIGWALVEPERAETAHGALIVLATLFAAVWGRAMARASWALLSRAADAPASTAGILRPRVRLSPLFHRSCDPDALRAACMHEEAHARHRDPLRVWLAQLVTDLQWPAPSARKRLLAWRYALELARDEEARRRGVRGEDLAAAILVAARLGIPATRGPVVGLLNEGAGLRERIRWALAPLSTPPPDERGFPHVAMMLIALLSAATICGASCGESVMRFLLR